MSIDPLLGGPSGDPAGDAGPPPRRSRPDRPAPAVRPAVRALDHQRRPRGLLVGVLGACTVAAAIGVGVVVASGGDGNEAAATTTVAVTTAPPTVPATTVPSIDTVGSIWWLVNPQRALPADYVPADLVTPNVPIKPGATNTQVSAVPAEAFEAMVADAAGAGFQLQLNSGYRSFAEQQTLYDQYVADFGPEVAAERVAVPGTSEHQTGLAVDVGEVGLPDDQVFGDTQASVWVSDNAHRFGFILRYPPDKAEITGYANEPWHLRYVGPELAADLHASGLTMEEHFGLAPAGTPSTLA